MFLPAAVFSATLSVVWAIAAVENTGSRFALAAIAVAESADSVLLPNESL